MRPGFIEFYHGTSDALGITNMLVPPNKSGVISEKGRRKNLNKIFMSRDIGLAKIYAGRACSSLGGNPIILRVISPVNVTVLSEEPGASVYYADWAFCEAI